MHALTFGRRTMWFLIGWVAVTAIPVSGQVALDAVASGLEWRLIGPAIMGGRIADLAVVESDPAVFYVGTATGGVWKTVNRGTTFEPLFDDQSTSSIGDVTLAPSNPNVVWVGTGEPQNRQSSPWGNGVYRSTDAGRSWEFKGLEATHHIARIVVHPRDPDVAYVAAVGQLWASGPERGVYKTSDGGATWERVLYVDERTGAIDLAMDPGDPQTLFAAMYQRQRTSFGFNGGGPGSGIYRTTDGGRNWEELTSGLPAGDKGRIGLDIFRGDGSLVYAIVEAQEGQGVYRSTDRGETWELLSDTNNRPMYYSQIRVDPSDPERIYLGGANLYRSSDGGRSFTSDAARDVHSDHHALWIDPANSNHLILGGDGGVSVTFDRGEEWRQLTNLPLAQFYEIGVDMRDPYYVCGGLQDNGSWCGPSQTLSDQGIRNGDWYNVGGGDGFFTVIDPTDPTVLYSESQGGRVQRLDLNTMERTSLQPVGRPGDDGELPDMRWNWDTPIVISSHDPATIYVGSNFLFRSTDRGHSWTRISPDLTRQIDRDTLSIMGARLSARLLSRNDGISSYGNLTTIGESPVNPDVLYAGTDDGNVQVTRDGGTTWTNVTANVRALPERTYVTRVVASRFAEGRVYAVFDGHRNADFAPHVYVSEDYGARWRAIVSGLPERWSVNAITEHPRNPNLLFVGNEVGVFFTIDRGERWVALRSNLPTVPVDDIAVHPRDNDLVIGTHGRGAWIMDDITPLEELSGDVLAAEAHLFSVRTATSFNPYRPQGWTPGAFVAPNPPSGARIRYYLAQDLSSGEGVVAGASNGNHRQRDEEAHVRLSIISSDGELVRELDGPATAGLHELIWDLRYPRPYEPEEQQQGGFFGGAPLGPKVLPGTYTVRLEAGGGSVAQDFEVRLDPRVQISRGDLLARQQAMMSMYALAKPLYETGNRVQALQQQVREIQALLEVHEDAPQTVVDLVREIGETLSGIGRDLREVRSALRGGSAIEGSTSRPTPDQLWQIDRAWEAAPGLIEQLNEVITTRMPALNRQLNEYGLRPDPGEPVEVPRRPAG